MRDCAGATRRPRRFLRTAVGRRLKMASIIAMQRRCAPLPGSLQHRQVTWRRAARKGLVDARDLGVAEHQPAGGGVVLGVRRRRAFGMANTDGWRTRKASATWRGVAPCAPAISAAAGRRRRAPRKIVVAERAVGDDGDAVPLAPRDHGVLDRALLQMVEHLVAGDLAGAGDASASSRSSTSKLLTPQERILPAAPASRTRRWSPPADGAAPVQQVAVEPVGPQARERALAGGEVPRRDALLGSTFETRNTSSRRPAIASPTTASASPYISAVSMWSGRDRGRGAAPRPRSCGRRPRSARCPARSRPPPARAAEFAGSQDRLVRRRSRRVRP